MTVYEYGASEREGLPPTSISRQERGLIQLQESGFERFWIACREPERPPDEDMVLHGCCPACYLKVPAECSVWPFGDPIKDRLKARLDEFGAAEGAIPWRGE